MTDQTPDTPTPEAVPEEIVQDAPRTDDTSAEPEATDTTPEIAVAEPELAPTGVSHEAVAAMPATPATPTPKPGAPARNGGISTATVVILLLAVGLAAVILVTNGFGAFKVQDPSQYAKTTQPSATPGDTKPTTPTGKPSATPPTGTPGATPKPGTTTTTPAPKDGTPVTPVAEVPRDVMDLLADVEKGNGDAVRKALAAKPALAKAADNRGVTALHQAASVGDLEIVKLLLNTGADPNALDITSGETTLHPAARKGDAAIIKALIAKGAKVNARNGGGSTPLHYAAQGGSVPAIEALAAAGANMSVGDNRKQTPLAYARASGQRAAAAALLKRGAKP